MAVSDRKHTILGAGEQPSREGINAGVESVNDFITVANVTERNALATAVGASASRPLLVWREDMPTGGGLELTTDGSTWRNLTVNTGTWRSRSHTTGSVIPTGLYVVPTGWATVPGDDGSAASGISYGSGVFTVAATGRYRCRLAVAFETNSAGTRGCALNKTANDSGALARQVQQAAASQQTAVACEFTERLVAGTQVHMLVFQSSGANLAMSTVSGVNRCSISYEGPA